MEILINIPAFLHPLFELLGNLWLSLQHLWENVCLLAAKTYEGALQIRQLPYSNVFLPVIAIVLVFWPILLSAVMAIAAVWAWIFWLFTSIILGIVQLGYASYQFLMIAVNIAGLSTLKTYAIVRNQCLQILDKQGSDGGRRRKSRRRLWRQRLDNAASYEEFLKIRIEPKDVKKTPKKKETVVTSKVDAALPAAKGGQGRRVQRSSSFSGGGPSNLHSSSSSPDENGLPRPHIPRIRSFSGKVKGEDEEPIEHDAIVIEELGRKTADLLVTTTSRLEEARLAAQSNPADAEAFSSLKYLLAGVVKRNHLRLDDIMVENARSIAETGQYGLSNQSRQMIRRYHREVEQGLDWIAEAPHDKDEQQQQQKNHASLSDGISLEREASFPLERQSELGDSIMLVRKMKQNMGRTALMLSGGGAQAMYHLGVIRALIESKLYDDIKVVSGTSGGSISAAMCAIKTAEELHSDVCVTTVSTDYMWTGEMKKRNIRWFPPMWDMAAYWMKHKLLVDSDSFSRTCEFYFKDYTFEEAFERTGKHVCITVSASRASTAQRLLLNHISTPHVTVASAVRASCALPGVMAPAKLIVKNSNGTLEPFEVDGVEWIDGSVQADLPFQRISTLFAVTSFIVSQTNFHIVPFLNKAHHPNQKSAYWRLFQTMEWDIRSRALKLSRLGLFPKVFGQDISKVFKQKYHGQITIVPRFTTKQTFGLNALSNPTVKDMEGYLKYSQIATWPYLNAIRDMIRFEKALDDCLSRLEARMRILSPDIDWSNQDDVESIETRSVVASSSNRVRIIGRPLNGHSFSRDRDSDILRRENQKLREEVELLRRQLNEKAVAQATTAELICEEEKKEREPLLTSSTKPRPDSAEGSIWKLVRSSSKG